MAYGGARGGGKSWAMRRKFVLLALRHAGLQLLLLRRTLPELMENHGRPLQRELAGIADYIAGERAFLLPNGSRIRLGYCDPAAAVYQYQGQEYDVIGLEEATHFTEAQMQFLSTCNRATGENLPTRMYYTCNPGGVGHAWVKRLFIDRRYREAERKEDYAFIPARVYDNKVLLARDPGYIRALSNLPEHLRRAHLEGDWDALAGQYFPEFRRDSHVCEPFALPAWWRRFRAMDWGYNDPCCVLWFACAPDGRIYAYREEYARQVLSSAMAARVKALSAGEKTAYTVASPDAWQRRAFCSRPTARGAEHSGCVRALRRAAFARGNSRVLGWQRVREYLSDARTASPFCKYFPAAKTSSAPSRSLPATPTTRRTPPPARTTRPRRCATG